MATFKNIDKQLANITNQLYYTQTRNWYVLKFVFWPVLGKQWVCFIIENTCVILLDKLLMFCKPIVKPIV